MCGIAGFMILRLQFKNAKEIGRAMGKIIQHRGPDDFGIWIDKSNV